MNRLSPLASAVLAVFAVPAAMAQQAAAPASSASAPSTLPTVRVQGTSERDQFTSGASSIGKVGDLRDAPQSVTIINKALLQSQGATSLSDALRNVPGVTLGGAEGGQIGNNINLNGFSARTDIYLDGFRDRGQYFRDTFALDSVEVLMGPSSMLFGRGSTGGVINQVSKRPSLTQATEVGGLVTTNGLVRATVDHNLPLGPDSALRFSVMGQDGKPTTRDEMKNKDYGFAPSLRLGIDTPTEITLSALLQHNKDMPDYGVSPLNGSPVPVDRNAFFGYKSDRFIQDIIALNMTVQKKLTSETTLNNRTSYNDVRVNAVETTSQSLGTVGANGFTAFTPAYTSGLPLSSIFVRLQSHDRVIHDKSISNQTELLTSLMTGTVKHNLIGGLELTHDSYVNQAYYRNGTCNGVALNAAGTTAGYTGCAPLIGFPYVDAPGNVPSTTGNLVSSGANSGGIYLNDTAELNKQFKVVGGLRYDRYQAVVQNAIPTATAPARTDQTVNFTSVRLGGIWQPSDTQSYYASYSTSFNPTLEQLTITTGATSPLPPEHNKAYEAGGKWDLMDGNLSLNTAVFRIEKFNARSQGADGTYIATGTIRVDGVRAGGSGQLMRGWKVFAGYAFLDAEITNGIAVGTTGKVPLNTPKHSATLWSTYEFAPHWELGGGVQYLSSRFMNNTNLTGVPAYARWDGTLAYRTPKYDIRLNVFNLTNKYFYDTLVASDGGRAVPGTGRSAMLSFTYHL